MVHTYTEELLLRLLYNEFDLFDKLEFEFALEDDSTLMEVYEDFAETKEALSQILISPRKSVTDKILSYSQNKI